MYRGSYLNNLISTVESNLHKDSNNVVFVNNHDGILLSKNQIDSILDKNNDYHVLTHEYNKNQMQTAFEPFIEWIRQIYIEDYKSSISEEKFIQMCDVYHNHTELFLSYLKTGVCTRKEDIIASEIEYEQNKLLISIIAILRTISKKRPLFIVLNNIQYACGSTIRLLLKYLQNYICSGIGLVVTYNKIIPVDEYMKEDWQELCRYIEEHKLVIDLGDFTNINKGLISKNFTPKKEKVEDYIDKLNNMLMFLTLDQAEEYLLVIYQRIEREKFNINSSQKFNLISIYALVTLYRGNASNAFMLCKTLQSGLDENNLSSQFVYYYINTLAQEGMIQIDSAAENANKCIEIAEQLGNDYLKFKACILYAMVRCYGWSKAYNEYRTEYDVHILEEEMINAGFLNTLAYYYLDICFDSEKQNEVRLDESGYFKKTLDIAKQLGNNNLIVESYEKMIVIYSTNGKHEHVDYLYNKYVNIVKELRLMYTDECFKDFPYDGLGYNYSIREQYVQANDFFNESLKLSYSRKMPEEVASTFYNKAINAIAAGEYSVADECLDACFKIMNNIGIITIFQCNTSKLYGLKALCNYYMDLEYKCYININIIERLLLHIVDKTDQKSCAMKDDDLFLYHFVKGLLHKKNDAYKDAESEFNIADIHMRRSHSFMFCTYPLYASELSDLYSLMGEQTKATSVLKECINFCEKYGYNNKKQILASKLIGCKPISQKYNLSMKKAEVLKLIDMSRKVGNKIKCEIRQQEVVFLSTWQDFLRKERSSTKLFGKEAVDMLKNTFNFDGILYIKVIDKKPKILYSDLERKLTKEEIDYIYIFFKQRNNMLSVSRMDKIFNEYDGLLNIFDKNSVFSITGIPLSNDDKVESILISYMTFNSACMLRKTLLTKHQLSIVKYAFYQLDRAIEKTNRRKEIKNINDNLKRLVVTDQLTGLYNRQGLTRMLLDYAQSNKNKAILYIDLDNFKYYNDTFGHYVGDKILVLFANTLKSVLMENDIAVRYGGDEFIIIKELVDIQEAVDVAKELITNVSTYFRQEVMKILGDNVTIPDNKRLSSSIGIAKLNCDNKEKINEALRTADKALYIVKRRNKGGYELIQEDN